MASGKAAFTTERTAPPTQPFFFNEFLSSSKSRELTAERIRPVRICYTQLFIDPVFPTTIALQKSGRYPQEIQSSK